MALVTGSHRHVGTGFRNGRVPDTDIKVVGQSAPVGNAHLAQVGTKEDGCFVGPLQRHPELAGLVGLGIGG